MEDYNEEKWEEILKYDGEVPAHLQAKKEMK